jgi:hypothetical protein
VALFHDNYVGRDVACNVLPPSAETSQSDVLNDGREGVGSNSVALHFCLNPPRDYLGNLRLFSNVLVVTICDHGGIYPGWTMGQPPDRRCKQCEVLFASDVILRSEESQYRTRDSGDGSIGSLGSKEVLVLTRCVGDVKLCRSTDKRRRRTGGSRIRSSPAPSSTSFFAWASSCGSSGWGEYPTPGEPKTNPTTRRSCESA